jgi:DNA helicase IV
VLPALGEHAVEQRAVSELVDGVEPTLTDPPDVERLKADPRLAEVVARAVELRLESEPEELYLRLEGEVVRVRAREVRALLGEVREREGTHELARERFRMALVRRFYAAYGEALGGGAVRDGEQIEKVLKADGYLNRILEAAWPGLVPAKLLRALYTQPAFLAEAADGVLDEGEQALLRRRQTGWSNADVALLDELNALVGTPPRSYGHVLVDEAQDLSPMQLRMIARRAREGGLTLLGDVAQATGAVVYGSWDEVLPQLPHAAEAEVEELLHAYRVPSEIMDVALPLLPTIAPDVAAPIAYRTGAAPPLVRLVDEAELLREAYREAARLAREDGLVALIVPDELIEPALAEGGLDEVPLLTARGAKGLEFDHVIVLEPALLAEREQGLRELYVALTRPTKTLVILHSRPLPPELGRS